MRFTLRQLEYFVAAGESRSVTLAAQRINISQASISSAISHLEAEFGVQLFLRHHAQGVSLTPEGQKLLKEARAVLKQVEGLTVSAGALAHHLVGPIDVGCFVTLLQSSSPSFATLSCASMATWRSGCPRAIRKHFSTS